MKYPPLAKCLLGLTLASCIAVPLVAAGSAQASPGSRPSPAAASSTTVLAPVTAEVVDPSSATRPGETAVTFRGAPDTRVVVTSTDLRDRAVGRIAADGTLTASLPLGEAGRSVTVFIRGELAGSNSSSQAVLVSDPLVLPAVSRFELVETQTEGDLVHTTLRGTAGAQYVLSAWNTFGKTIAHSQGAVPEDGLVRLDVPASPAESVTLHAHTSGSNGAFAEDFTLRNPGTSEPAEPVVAEPAPGEVDPGFTVTPGDDDGDQTHHPDLRYEVTKSGLQFGGYAQIRVEDWALVGSDLSYDVEVFVDGEHNGRGHISAPGADRPGPGVGLLAPMNMGGVGDHQVEVEYQGETVLTLTVTL